MCDLLPLFSVLLPVCRRCVLPDSTCPSCVMSQDTTVPFLAHSPGEPGGLENSH